MTRYDSEAEALMHEDQTNKRVNSNTGNTIL